jgi:hypothetical protein
MHVVWRRPDGFHGASPSDFKVLEIAGQSRMWLHKTDTDWFPFRISGGWQDDDATKRLNHMTNLLDQPEAPWLSYMITTFHHSRHDDAKKFWEETTAWLKELKDNLKGDKWEVEIMALCIDDIAQRLSNIKQGFLKGAQT